MTSKNFMMFFQLLVISTMCLQNVRLLPDVIRIGGVFETTDDDLVKSFGYAIDRVNADHSILRGVILSPQIKRLEPQNSFNASKEVCNLLRSGVAAIFGPQSSYMSPLMESLLSKFDIPHIETRWDYSRKPNAYSVNVFPHWEALARAFKDLVVSVGWKSFTILYEEDEALIRLQYLLQISSSSKSTDQTSTVSLRKLTPQYRLVMKELRKNSVTKIVLDCKTENLHLIFQHAKEVGLLTDYHSYIITNLDLHTVDLSEPNYSNTNITGFRLVDPDNLLVKKIQSDLSYREKHQKKKSQINTETGLIFDAVEVFSNALDTVNKQQNIDLQSISCDGSQKWSFGKTLISQMKAVTSQGLTGSIQFDDMGYRSDVAVEIIDLVKNNLVKMGEWNLNSGINFTRDEEAERDKFKDNLMNKTLRIVTVPVTPYTIVKPGSDPGMKNGQFEGFCIDLIDAIAKKIGFKYEIYVAADETNGKMNLETGEWNGMIGDLLGGKADLAIADLTITYEREQAVDFTMPFMNLGISILFMKPEKPEKTLFSFLSPLSWDVWLYMLTAYLGVSIFMFIVARFSPYEWQSPHPCDQEIDVLENQFTLMNSMWFTIGSLMQQGSDLAPKAWSTRMVAGTWWFFTLIMISSYTANLAAFLTVQRMVSPIESAEDLARQTTIKYGCYEGGSTENFFRNSKMGTYQRMWSFMESERPSVLTKSAKEGTDRVLKGNYAYLMESTTIEYVTERNCKLTQVGGWLDSKGYGIATPPGSPYRRFISSAILKLQEETQLDVLKIRWWKKMNVPSKKCEKADKSKSSTGTASELTLANVGGVFVVLLFGVGFACIIAVLEFIWKTKRVAEHERETLCTEMIREIRFAVGCQSSRRPNTKKSQEFIPAEENFVTFQGFASLSSKEPLA